MKKPEIVISVKPVDLDTMLNEEFNEECQKLVALHESAPMLLDQLQSLLSVVDSIAHRIARFKGLEREILPFTDAIREKINRFE
jgi:hypothetical protein